MSKRSSIALAVLLLAGVGLCGADRWRRLACRPDASQSKYRLRRVSRRADHPSTAPYKSAWTKEVDKMTKWGALVDPQDRDALIDYLSSNFPVDKPEYAATRVPKSEKRAQKK